MLCAGVSDQLFPGASLGNQMVGLQRTFPESERKSMSLGRGDFWPGGNRADLSDSALL